MLFFTAIFLLRGRKHSDLPQISIFESENHVITAFGLKNVYVGRMKHDPTHVVAICLPGR